MKLLMIIRALQCSSINPTQSTPVTFLTCHLIIWLPDDMGNINTRQNSKRFNQKYVPIKWFLTITDLLENLSMLRKALWYLNLAATNADIKWHCQNPDNHNKSIFNPFFFHHICLSIENKNIIVSDKDTHKCQNNCSPQLANC